MASSSIESVWRALHDAHEPAPHPATAYGSAALPGQAWARTPGPSGLEGVWSSGRANAARVRRLRQALEDSLPLAIEQLQRLLGAITLAEVRQVLVTLARDIALVWCGSVLLGSGVGAVLGAFGGGIGAIPGAALGAEVGAAAGEALLALFGLKALAESMAASMPRALRAWRQGARDAWDDPPFHEPHDAHDTFRTRQAAWELAQGHLALLQALLTALLAMLARGGTARALALHEITANGRLGPAVARWLEEQEVPLRQALSWAGRRSEADAPRVTAAAGAPPVTPSRLREDVRARASLGPVPFAGTRARARVGNTAGRVDEMGSFTATGSDVFHGPGMTRIGSDAVSVRVSENVAPIDGVHDVVVHGIPYDESGAVFLVDDLPTNAGQVADAVRANPSWDGRPIRLLTCYGGCGPMSPAQELSNILNVPVQGATNAVGVARVPGSVPVVRNGGSWIDFQPH